MKLRVKNIGILSSAEVEINGITVVAGKNNSGKSTFGKALFAVFKTLCNFSAQVDRAKYYMLDKWLRTCVPDAAYVSPEARENFFKELKDTQPTREKLEFLLDKFFPSLKISGDRIWKDLDNAIEIIKLDERSIQNECMTDSLKRVFHNQIQRFGDKNQDSLICLTIAGEDTSVIIKNEEVVRIDNVKDLDLTPVYYDGQRRSDALLSNELETVMFPLRIIVKGVLGGNKSKDRPDDEMISAIERRLQKNYLKPILDRLQQICHGRVISTPEYGLKFVDENRPNFKCDINNVSTGLRTFLILQELIIHGFIKKRGVVILDEPEIHLHPEWQVILAEIIVLLQKTMDLHILLTTHSPYFISAVDVYSKKYGIVDKNKYYFSEISTDGPIVRDVTNDIAVIYDSLAQPYQTIEDVAMEL